MEFARRTRWSREENALARATATAKARGALLDLTISNPLAAELPYPEDEIAEALADRRGFAYRPSAFGEPAAREAVADYYRRRGLPVEPDQVVITASTSEAYHFLLRLLCDPGDRVLLPRPSYPLFDFLLDLADVEAAPYPLAYDGRWHLDRAATAAADGPGVRAALVVSPNNPTGSVLDPESRAFLAGAFAERALIADEVFGDYATSGLGAASWIGAAAGLAFSLSGLSKVAGLPQLKLGWMVVHGPEDRRHEALARLEIIADTYLSVATPVQVALPKLLPLADRWQDALRARLADNRASLAAACAGTAVRTRHSDGGWYAMLDLPRIHTDERWAIQLLESAGVLTHPGYLFDLGAEACLVVSLLPPPPVFRRGIDLLLSLAEGR